MKTILLHLTDEESTRLERTSWTDDQGPIDEGWQSAKMEAFGKKIRAALDNPESGVLTELLAACRESLPALESALRRDEAMPHFKDLTLIRLLKACITAGKAGA